MTKKAAVLLDLVNGRPPGRLNLFPGQRRSGGDFWSQDSVVVTPSLVKKLR
jgi:hypothetical protein